MQTINITCRGCWRIVALGISYRKHTELVFKDGDLVAKVEKNYPSHGKEECPKCGRVHDCGPADFWENEQGRLMSDDDARHQRLPEEITRFHYRGPIEGPIYMDDPVQYLPEDDPLEEQWL